MKARRGQVAVYLVLVLVAITIFALTNVGAFLAVRAKNHAMNEGDAAALASARRQAQLLNRIGQLNLEHVLADLQGDWERGREIVREQRRLCFLGPLDCLRDAQVAAADNGARVSPEMTGLLAEHVSDIRHKYMAYPELYPEPWPGGWAEYAAELSQIVSEGICAGTDNIDFIDMVECFPLTSKSFYSMIWGRAWCKIVVAGWQDLLGRDSTSMPSPVQRELGAVVNSEICSLHLEVRSLPPMSAREREDFYELLGLNGLLFPEELGKVADLRGADDPSRLYFFYADDVWRQWTEMDPRSKYHFPLIGRIRPEFDVMGCTSVYRVIEKVPRLLSETEAEGPWSAAAKPFGLVHTRHGAASVTAEELYGFVLPSFEEARLIPLSAAYVGCQDTSTADKTWLHHVRDHVPQYLSNGVRGLPPSCPYCKALIRWEDKDFREEIARWIEANAETCTRSTPGPGPDYEGGTSYAH